MSVFVNKWKAELWRMTIERYLICLYIRRSGLWMAFDFEIDSQCYWRTRDILSCGISPWNLFKDTNANVEHATLNTALLHAHKKATVWRLKCIHVTTALFRAITQRVAVSCVLTFWDDLSGPTFKGHESKIATGCPETPARNYHHSLRNDPEKRSSHLPPRWKPEISYILVDYFSLLLQ